MKSIIFLVTATLLLGCAEVQVAPGQASMKIGGDIEAPYGYQLYCQKYKEASECKGTK